MPAVATASVRTLLAAACALCATQVLAAPLFSDDAESGTLTSDQSPPGAWARLGPGPAANTISSHQEAAHRGTRGIRHIDAANAPVKAVQGLVASDLAPVQGSVTGRFWFRHTPQSTTGNLMVFKLEGVDAQVRIRHDGGELHWDLAGRSGEGDDWTTFIGPDSGPSLNVREWQLVELLVEGMGSANGKLSLFVDRKLVVARSDLDFKTRVLRGLDLGGVWSDEASFMGLSDFDDVRVSVEPPASRIGLALASDAETANGCVPITLSLHDSPTDALAPAPYDVDVSLVAPERSGRFFEDDACTREIDRKSVPAESTSTTVYFAPGSAGTFTLKAEHLDFFPASLSLVSTGTGGLTPATPGQDGICGPRCPDPWTIGCQASPAQGALSFAALLVLGTLRRKRS